MKSFYIFVVLVAVFTTVGICEKLVDASSNVVAITSLEMTKVDVTVLRTWQSKVSQEDKEAYLLALLDSEHSPIIERASAARLLPLMPSVRTIQALLKYLSMEDEVHKDRPVVIALSRMGDACVDPLLQFIDKSNNKKDISLAVEALMLNKGSGYASFVKANGGRLSKKVNDALLRYAIVD